MATPLKISARNAGQVELKKYCPRCSWYLMHFKKMPFKMGMPGVMFYLEQVEKAFIVAYLEKYNKLPADFGPFAHCTHPVDFPFRMSAFHKETGVTVTAQVDMMLANPDDTIAVIDLKTAKSEGGGIVFLPQYEIQLIGYSWVTEQAKVGKVGLAGLIYCEIDHEIFKDDPMSFMEDHGILVPFHFTPHPVELDFARLTRCLKEMDQVWNSARPPQGAEKCEDCVLLNRLFDFEAELRATDSLEHCTTRRLQEQAATATYHRSLARGNSQQLEDIFNADYSWAQDGGMLANWDFS
jgi:hypothetical protein